MSLVKISLINKGRKDFIQIKVKNSQKKKIKSKTCIETKLNNLVLIRNLNFIFGLKSIQTMKYFNKFNAIILFIYFFNRRTKIFKFNFIVR